MTSISVEKSVDVTVDVDVDIYVDDVVNFIFSANNKELEEIAVALAGKGVHSSLIALDAATVRHLIERVNVFGLDDMLDDLKREGERIGVFMTEVKV
ncbi:hypothetical protein D7V21_05130 [Acinetobacter guerrae]|uniref:Uncharacterized protein n=1 Tax=Acinetobacter guerrae TaxID=1843371 RepID=A0A3A8ENV7_9GAMM|nr:hypothetical protein [Acinetobacter guerrae]RKG35166.1 hypothetical protein D7V21_05130 [Acinetobacter guerrae]